MRATTTETRPTTDYTDNPFHNGIWEVRLEALNTRPGTTRKVYLEASCLNEASEIFWSLKGVEAYRVLGYRGVRNNIVWTN